MFLTENTGERSPLINKNAQKGLRRYIPHRQVSSESKQSQHNSDSPNHLSGGSAWIWGSLILLNGTCGLAALTLARTTKMANSLGLALFIHVFMCICMCTSSLALGYICSQRYLPTYESMFRHHIAIWAERVATILIFLAIFVSCIGYLVGIKDQVSALITDNVDPRNVYHWYLQPEFQLFVISTILILPMLMIQQIEYLKYASAGASICIVYLACVIIAAYYHPDKLLNPKLSKRVIVSPREESRLACVLTNVGAYLAAYSNQALCIPIFARTSPRTYPTFVKMYSFTTGLSFIFFNIFAIIPVVTLGDIVPFKDLLLNFNPKYFVTATVYGAYILKLSLEYPVMAFILRQNVLSIMPRSWYEGRITKVKIGISVLLFATTLGLAASIPSILTAIQLMGVTAGLICLVGPGILVLKVLESVPNFTGRMYAKVMRFGACFHILVGVAGTLISCYIAAMGYWWKSHGETMPCFNTTAVTNLTSHIEL